MAKPRSRVMKAKPVRQIKKKDVDSTQRVRGRHYEGASKTKRTKHWITPNSSANQETLVSLPLLRARSRDLVRNNGYAFKAVNELAANTVGTGIIAKIAGKSDGQTSKLNDKWKSWAEGGEIDADGLHDIYGIQDQIALAMFESGEVLLRRRWRQASDKFSIPFQIQVLEADFIDTFKNELLPNGGRIVQGIEFSPLGVRVAYWLYPQHPGEMGIMSLSSTGFSSLLPSKRVSADDIIHLFVQQRPGQVRGVPRGAPVVLKMRDFDDVQDAMIVMQKIASCFTAFVTTGDDDDPATEGEGDDDNDVLPEKVSPGLIVKLDHGQDVKFGSPPALVGYQDFSKISLKNISCGYMVPHEVMTGDFSEFTFSSSRMSWLGWERNIERFRWLTFIPRVNKRLFQWFLEGCQFEGIKTDGASSVWTPPRRQMINPTEETRALVEAVRAGLMSLSEAIRQLGYDPEEVLNEKKSDNDLLDKLGLILDTDPRHVTQVGMNQPTYAAAGGKGK